MTPVISGPLRPSSDAPAVGERSEEIAQLGGVVVAKAFVSGAVAAPVDSDPGSATNGSSCSAVGPS